MGVAVQLHKGPLASLIYNRLSLLCTFHPDSSCLVCGSSTWLQPVRSAALDIHIARSLVRSQASFPLYSMNRPADSYWPLALNSKSN